MSVNTYFEFRNVNDLKYLEAINGTEEDKQEWEDNYGAIDIRPGASIEGFDEIIEETGEEYDGWIIPIDKIPKSATHIIISRG